MSNLRRVKLRPQIQYFGCSSPGCIKLFFFKHASDFSYATIVIHIQHPDWSQNAACGPWFRTIGVLISAAHTDKQLRTKNAMELHQRWQMLYIRCVFPGLVNFTAIVHWFSWLRGSFLTGLNTIEICTCYLLTFGFLNKPCPFQEDPLMRPLFSLGMNSSTSYGLWLEVKITYSACYNCFYCRFIVSQNLNC
jgi:hypothetical protein